MSNGCLPNSPTVLLEECNGHDSKVAVHSIDFNAYRLDNKENQPQKNSFQIAEKDSGIEEGESLDSVSEHLSISKTVGRKPGVILLGRGNSFTLGRSELIVLHNPRTPRSLVKSLRSSRERKVSESCVQQPDTCHSSPPVACLNQLSSPPVSNGCSAVEEGGHLEFLWRQVETLMTDKRESVEEVLEDFGVSTADVGHEEEAVWQAIQDNFHV